jgi:hypothetical protein
MLGRSLKPPRAWSITQDLIKLKETVPGFQNGLLFKVTV